MRIKGGAGTPVPKRSVELNSAGNGPIIEYTLSPEELQKYVSVSQTRNKPTVQSRLRATEERSRQAKIEEEMEEKRMSEQLKDGQEVKPFIPDKVAFLKEVAKGKSVSKAGVAIGIPKGSIAYWTDKWGLKGIKPDKAKLLLDEMTIDGEGAVVKSVNPMPLPLPADYEAQLNDKQAEINRLLDELASATQINKRLGKENDDFASGILERDRRISQLIQERDDYKRAAEDLEGKALEADALRKRLNDALAEKNMAYARVAELEAALTTIDQAVTAHKSDHDPVNHPSHYTAGAVECIDAIESATIGLSGGQAYATGAAIKYLWRWSRKNGVEDLQKAAWYVERLIAMLEQGSIADPEVKPNE